MDPSIEKALALIDEATGGMSDEELNWHAEGKWSSANILEHLSRAFAGTVKGAQRLLEAGKAECRPCSLREHLFIFTVARVGYFPYGRKSPEAVVPKGLPPRQVMGDIRANLIAVDSALARAEERFGGAKIMLHPVLGPLTVREWRRFHFVHTRHHMKQIRRLRAHLAASQTETAQVRS